MTVAILDTTVIIHLSRKYEPAHRWFLAQQATFSMTSITWAEVMVGVANKRAQTDALDLMSGMELVYLTTTDQAWALQQIQRLRFVKNLSLTDCLIASVAYRLQVPLYTHNLRDMTPLVGSLAIKPYA